MQTDTHWSDQRPQKTEKKVLCAIIIIIIIITKFVLGTNSSMLESEVLDDHKSSNKRRKAFLFVWGAFWVNSRCLSKLDWQCYFKLRL